MVNCRGEWQFARLFVSIPFGQTSRALANISFTLPKNVLIFVSVPPFFDIRENGFTSRSGDGLLRPHIFSLHALRLTLHVFILTSTFNYFFSSGTNRRRPRIRWYSENRLLASAASMASRNIFNLESSRSIICRTKASGVLGTSGAPNSFSP